MPTVLRLGPYRFFFYSNESGEPPHVHVQSNRGLAKYWLEPVGLSNSKHLPAHELTLIGQHVEENLSLLLEAWHEYHDR